MSLFGKRADFTSFVSNFTSAPTQDFGIYSRGYALAADRLATLLVQATHFGDHEAYPVVFLYRHAFELSLKHVVYSAAKLSALRNMSELQGKLINSHKLVGLGNTAMRSLKLLFPSDKELAQLLHRIESTCAEFEMIDPDSFSYRYPINTRGGPSTPRGQSINLSAFALHMSALLEELDTVHFGLNIENDVAEELRTLMQESLSSSD